MGKRQVSFLGDSELSLSAQEGSDEKTSSDVKGSGRFLFALAKILVDVIDDELQVSDAHKCAGKKVDMGKRAVRVVTSAGSKFSMNQAQAKLGVCELMLNLKDCFDDF